ncbi:hypothetical protein [Microvirga massiliensis]|uniref:hypothetical protein n=1 Tax=Microvirga massiliensis TaxID=1033741 RepID=UPI000AAFA0F4|nr:hypothetical protein [Microvirga massiliensis]
MTDYLVRAHDEIGVASSTGHSPEAIPCSLTSGADLCQLLGYMIPRRQSTSIHRGSTR